MVDSISASLGAMGSLVGKLDVLLLEASDSSEDDPGDFRGRLWLPKGLKDGIGLLKEDLEEISSYIQDLSEVEDPPLTAKCWMREVRELSYDIDDYIDSFARPGRSRNTKTRFICKISHIELTRLPKKKLAYRRVVDRISEFRIRAQDANLRYERYELDSHKFRRRYAPVGPMLPIPYQGDDPVIDGRMRELIDTIASEDRDHHLKVVSIVGPGGIGKTTLVRVLYNKIWGKFQFRTFIRMTRNPNVKTVLREILRQLQRQQPHVHREDVDLIGEIRKYLQDKRYLIIIDDLWSASVWNLINRAFPEGSQCSRVIITTQIEEVALTCCNYHSEFVLEMRSLDSFHSRKLFFSRVFGTESDCPGTFKGVSNKILEICGGLPFALISMASLLASHPVVSGEKWTYISYPLSFNLRTSSTSEVVRQVLNLSYNNLTHCLKTCLLYLNMYPEGYTICKHDLVKQWVAEGFIPATEGRDMAGVAGSYFDELIDRRFLQPACIKYDNAMVSCTVHDMVRDLIAYKSSEENFVMVIDNYRKNVELCDNVHRLSLHFVDAKHSKKPRNIRTSQIRSLSFFGFFMCMPNITEFKLLCVLNVQLYGHHGDDIFDLTGISKLFHLRYLKVAGDIRIDLPKHMRGLKYMETLDIATKVTAVPWDIIHLPCLLNLHLPFETNLMDWIGSMRSESVKKLGKLINLRDLCLTYFTTPPPDHLERDIEALGSLVTGLGNLKTLSLVPGSSHEKAVHGHSKLIISWDGFVPPLPLQRFEWSLCSCTFPRVPKWIGEFGNLCILKITVNELLRDGVDILKGLPALTNLSLCVHAAPVEMVVFDKVGFSVLKYLKFRCSAPWLKFEADAMPNLLKLKLGFNAHRVNNQCGGTHISIEHLSGLNEISVKIWGAGADVESALTAAIINHPSNPQISIQSADWIVRSYKGRDSATEEKEHGRIEQDDMMEEAEDDKSRKDEDENKDAEEEKHGRIEQEDTIEEIEDEISRADENKQDDIRIFTPEITSSHLSLSAPEALTDPTHDFISGSTPGDLASDNGHKSSPAYSWLGGSQGNSSGLIVKKTMKVDIPVDKYPTYNFVGRILGPRGNSLKRVEANTDCRVLIRGRGSIKDPAQEEMMRGKPGYEHLNEPLHILVEAELPVEIIDARLMQTREILEDLLKPVDESQDFFKKQQLWELAMLNSTLHEEGMQGSSLSGTDSDVIERDLLQPPSGDSSGAVRNAAQAAPMIHDEVFRVRKKAAQCEDVKVSLTDEHTKLDIEQILKEAQHRWLRPAEICEILKNYRNFRIAPEPPNRPPSGSLFLFDRKVLRFFRKDGHNWRQKNDQKTVKEAHERLKSGSIDVLHCYSAHGEENINFQRRTYWMLEEDFMHIVLVHYLEIKGGKSSRTRAKNNMIQDAAADSPLSQLPSRTRGGESSLCRQAPEYEEAESEYLKQNSVQRIFIQEEPDIALSIGRSRTKVELDP